MAILIGLYIIASLSWYVADKNETEWEVSVKEIQAMGNVNKLNHFVYEINFGHSIYEILLQILI